MYIRPVRPDVRPADRPAGAPLLRGLLAAGAYVWNGAAARTGGPAGPGHASGVRAGDEDEGEAWSEAGAEAGAGDGAGDGPAPARGAAAAPGGLAGELATLAGLAREGLLTPEEFAAAKSRLLGPG